MNDSMRPIRQLVWLYFWLLLTEGALRKWIVPGLSSALLIVRDPIVLAIYVMAFARGVFPRGALVGATVVLAATCAIASLAGSGTPLVTVFGLRANFLHLPLILVLPQVLRPSDVRRMGYALLVTLPFMAMLGVLQFKGGPDSRWNVGAGGQIGGQLFASEGKVRVSGTFSFVTGMASYLAFCSAFILEDLLTRRAYSRMLIYPAGAALLLTLAISGSRSAVVTVALVCAMVLYTAWRNPKQFGSIFKPIIVIAVTIAALLSMTSVFDEGIKLQQRRFTSAGGVQKGIVERYFQTFEGGWDALFYTTPLGYGLGVGTNAGAGLITGKRSFTLGEGEWQRVILESGFILGPAYLALRLAYLLAVIKGSLRGYQDGHIMPMLLLGAGGIDLVTGQFGQPTTLGFAVFIGGLALASAGEDNDTPTPPAQDSTPAATLPRGRSAYAERLHGGEAE